MLIAIAKHSTAVLTLCDIVQFHSSTCYWRCLTLGAQLGASMAGRRRQQNGTSFVSLPGRQKQTSLHFEIEGGVFGLHNKTKAP